MQSEVILLGQLKHPNLVKLIGYCCEEEERVLIYEFLPRGSLENHLFKRIKTFSIVIVVAYHMTLSIYINDQYFILFSNHNNINRDFNIAAVGDAAENCYRGCEGFSIFA